MEAHGWAFRFDRAQDNRKNRWIFGEEEKPFTKEKAIEVAKELNVERKPIFIGQIYKNVAPSEKIFGIEILDADDAICHVSELLRESTEQDGAFLSMGAYWFEDEGAKAEFRAELKAVWSRFTKKIESNIMIVARDTIEEVG